ncbi:MAG: FUSC family protein [Terriglobales bacterium]
MTLDRGAFGPILTSSARTAIAAAASFLIARLSGLPEAYWAAILTLVIMQSTLGAALKISGERFVGTLLGAIGGGLLARFLPQAWWVFGAGVFLLGIVCALFRLQNSYRFAGITLAIVMLVPRISPPWVIALHRFIEVSIGIVVGLAITAIWPEPVPHAG